MAKKNDPAFAIAKSDAKKLSRSEQRRMLDQGFIVDTKAEAAKVEPAMSPNAEPAKTAKK